MRKTKSLKKNIDFKRTLMQGKYVSGKIIAVYVKNIKEKNINFFGICVSKKHGNSVVRNKLKRWAREAYKENEKSVKQGYNIVVLYKKDIDISNINYWAVKDEINNLFSKLDIFYE